MNDRTTDFLASASSVERASFIAYYALVAALAVAPLWFARRLWPHHRRPLIVLAVWSACFGAFAFYWVPNDLSFWMPLLAGWWLLVGLHLAHGLTLKGAANHFPLARLVAVSIALMALLAAANAVFLILPNHDLSRNRAYTLAAQVAALTTANDLIITNGDDIMFLYVEYFAKRAALPASEAGLGQAITRARGRGGRVFLVGNAPSATLVPNATWQARGEMIWELIA